MTISGSGPRPLPIPAAVDEAGYARLASGLRGLLGVDLDQYRPAQMWRRVNSFAASRGLADADALLVACRQRPDLLGELRDMLTINVSEFFRDPEAWQRLRRRIATATCRRTAVSHLERGLFGRLRALLGRDARAGTGP